MREINKYLIAIDIDSTYLQGRTNRLMDTLNGFIETIGNTPLIRLQAG